MGEPIQWPGKEPPDLKKITPQMGVKGWLGWILAVLQALVTAISQL